MTTASLSPQETSAGPAPVFVSHGSPMIMLREESARTFLSGSWLQDIKPRAIVSVTAHWETALPAISLDPAPETMHDFGGFPRPLYEMQYPAPAAPDLARKAISLLEAAGFPVEAPEKRPLDHGTWVPLKLALPDASIPVIQMSVQPDQSPEWHFRQGQALAPLRRENVLVLGSGALTHNLRAVWQLRQQSGDKGGAHGMETPEEVIAFANWIATAIAQGRLEDLLAFEDLAPWASWNHPGIEHLLPLFTALGASMPHTAPESTVAPPLGQPLHRSFSDSVLAMDAYSLGGC